MGTCPSCSNITCKDRWTSSFEVKSHDIHDVFPFLYRQPFFFSFRFPLSPFFSFFLFLFLFVLVGHIYWRMSLIDCVSWRWLTLDLGFPFYHFSFYSASCLEYHGVNTSFHSIPLPACCIVSVGRCCHILLFTLIGVFLDATTSHPENSSGLLWRRDRGLFLSVVVYFLFEHSTFVIYHLLRLVHWSVLVLQFSIFYPVRHWQDNPKKWYSPFSPCAFVLPFFFSSHGVCLSTCPTVNFIPWL